ncbi:hypothetical protein [Flavobacterium hydatis]|uniref:Uncharacterized protein n=1 Tax=Flavobacterium hydatis TaxID=991 RepID=A0A086AM52_FLAHY|nr:hypothetical protein [Flavobacterium hydatis]KFF17766.1 hypothetical protein IW20_07300 [Flavobacterium hydatis]
MDLSDINHFILLLVTGAAIPIITTFFNNKSQTKRDTLKYKNDLKTAIENREFEEAKNYREYLMKTVEEIHQLLSYFEHNISLTKSLIESTKKLTPEESDTIYENELEKLIRLKSIVLSRFPDYYDNILNIAALHNIFWGNQRTLLGINIKENTEGYRLTTELLFETQNKTRKEIDLILVHLKKYSEKVNEKYKL